MPDCKSRKIRHAIGKRKLTYIGHGLELNEDTLDSLVRLVKRGESLVVLAVEKVPDKRACQPREGNTYYSS